MAIKVRVLGVNKLTPSGYSIETVFEEAADSSLGYPWLLLPVEGDISAGEVLELEYPEANTAAEAVFWLQEAVNTVNVLPVKDLGQGLYSTVTFCEQQQAA